MQKNSQDFSVPDAMKLAQKPAAQQLLAMLAGADPTLLEKASQQAAAGNFAQASQIIRNLLTSPEAQKLLDELGR